MLEHSGTFDYTAAAPFDVIVVGAGAVGLSSAVDMANRGLRVALLEAGPEKPVGASQKHFETARSMGHDLPGLHLGRFRCLGGTTNFWGGQLVPFAPMVFEQRPWVSPVAWPIGLQDIAPYYERAYDLLGMKTVIRDDAVVWRDIGIEPPPRTATIQPIFTRWTPEANFTIHFRTEIRENPSLVVLLEAQVAALLTDPEGVVTGVEIRFADGRKETLKAARVVLANGTVEISRLLQLPDQAGKQMPWAKNPWVGRAFIDHVDCYAGSVTPLDRHRFADLFENAILGGLKYSPKLRLSDDIQKTEQLLEISSHFVFNSSVSDNIQNLKIVVKGLMKGRIETSALSNPLSLIGTLRFIVPMAVRYFRHRRIMSLSDSGIQMRLTSEQAPLAESRITLRPDDTDAFGLPKVDVAWQIAPDTIETLARFAKYIRDYLEENRLATVSLDPRLEARDPAFLDQTDDANHQMGGARMAAGPDQGVVNADCAVFGTQNLYVAGAAVFPTSGFANPTFTAIALGMRLAHHIARDLGTCK